MLLRREGWHVNTKRIYRLYREEGLQVRTKQRAKRAAQARVPLPGAVRPEDTLPTYSKPSANRLS